MIVTNSYVYFKEVAMKKYKSDLKSYTEALTGIKGLGEKRISAIREAFERKFMIKANKDL